MLLPGLAFLLCHSLFDTALLFQGKTPATLAGFSTDSQPDTFYSYDTKIAVTLQSRYQGGKLRILHTAHLPDSSPAFPSRFFLTYIF